MPTKTSVQIGSTIATVFLNNESQEYYYSLSSVAGLIAKPASSPSEFLTSRASKASYDKSFTPSEFSDETGARYKLLLLFS